MNWDAISAVAEVLGATAVVISLAYVASQIKQANVQAQADAHSNWLTAWNETIKGWIDNRDTVQIMQNGFQSFSDLPRIEQAIFAMHLAALVNHWHLAADLFDRGLMDDELYRGATEVILSVCAAPGGREYFEAHYSAFPRGAQLLEMVQSGEGILPPWHVLAPWWDAGNEKSPGE